FRQQRLQENAHDAVTADTEPPQVLVVLTEVVCDALRYVRRQYRHRPLGEIPLEAASGQHSLERAIRIDQHPGAALAVGRTFSLEDAREHQRLPIRPPCGEGILQVTYRHAAAPLAE